MSRSLHERDYERGRGRDFERDRDRERERARSRDKGRDRERERGVSREREGGRHHRDRDGRHSDLEIVPGRHSRSNSPKPGPRGSWGTHHPNPDRRDSKMSPHQVAGAAGNEVSGEIHPFFLDFVDDKFCSIIDVCLWFISYHGSPSRPIHDEESVYIMLWKQKFHDMHHFSRASSPSHLLQTSPFRTFLYQQCPMI